LKSASPLEAVHAVDRHHAAKRTPRAARCEQPAAVLTELTDAILRKTGIIEILRNRMTLFQANQAKSAAKWANKCISFR
jgi:hypothetical protein